MGLQADLKPREAEGVRENPHWLESVPIGKP